MKMLVNYYDENNNIVGSVITSRYKTFNGFVKYGAKNLITCCGVYADKVVKVGWQPFSYNNNTQDHEQSYFRN